MRRNSKEVILSRGDSGGAIPYSIFSEVSNIITMFKYYEDSFNYIFLCATTNKSIADVSNRS